MGKASAAQRRAKARPPTKKAEAPRASSADKTEPAEHEDTHTREPESGTPLDAAAPAEPARQQDARHDQQDQGSPERDSASLNSALEARINALQSELDETRQTLAESHAAFAEQIVAMSSQHDQVRADVQAAADTDLATARAEASTAKERVRELEARVAELEQRDTAPAPPVPDKPAPLFPPRPPTETLASFVQALGYADQDYVRAHAHPRPFSSSSTQRMTPSIPASLAGHTRCTKTPRKSCGASPSRCPRARSARGSRHAPPSCRTLGSSSTRRRPRGGRGPWHAQRRRRKIGFPTRLTGMSSASDPAPGTPLERTKRSNSFDAGGAVLRALTRSPHYNENLHQLDAISPVPQLDLDAPAVHELYQTWVVKWEVPRKLFHCLTGFAVLSLYRFNVDLDRIVQVLLYMFLVIASADLLRLNSPAFERIYESVLGVLMRDGEKERVNGVVWYLIGVVTSLRLFPEDIACVSIIMLSWCDPCASTFGRLFGKRTPALPAPLFARRKSLAGFLAASVMGALVAYLFWGTGIAREAERASGLSWEPHGVATFGTPRMPDPMRTGWRGFAHGFAARDASFSAQVKDKLLSHAPAVPPLFMYIGCGFLAGFAEAVEVGGLDDNISIPIISGFMIWGLLYVWGRVVTA